jgi:hypothetical protein
MSAAIARLPMKPRRLVKSKSPVTRMTTSVEDGWRESSRPLGVQPPA